MNRDTQSGFTLCKQTRRKWLLVTTSLTMLVLSSITLGFMNLTSNHAQKAYAAASSCTPQLNAVSAFAAGQSPNVTIKGTCFGTNSPFTNNNSPYFRISINPSTPSEWHACYTGDAPADSVTCNVSSWTNTTIKFAGFSGAYGQNGWVVNKGTPLLIQIWNPQTGQGPGLCPLEAGGTGTTQCSKAAKLAKEILNNPNIVLSGRCVRQDIINTSEGEVGTAGTPVSAVLLSDLLAIANSQKVIVTAIESCGTGHSPNSDHYKGTAIDVGGTSSTLAAIALTIYNNRVSWSINELIFNPMPKGTTTLKYGKPFKYSQKILNAHRTHVHFSV